MPTETPATIRCETCDTEFSSTDAAELQAHTGHSLIHIDPGGSPVH